jgi:hypothetical protein
MSGERFVVGTGRCGSTLLSTMLAQHRDVVSLHEFFNGLDGSRRFAPGEVDGPSLAALLGAEQPVTTAVLARGHTADEIQYPFGSPGARYRPGDPVPWLLVTMLSRLFEAPDAAFDELLAFASARPASGLAEHCRAVFAFVAARAGGSIWIERSGSSLDYLERLAALYPEARFVHIHRDGHEAALSMRAHPFFRLGVTLRLGLLPEAGDLEARITHAIETPPPCWAVGRFFSDQVLRGFRAMPSLGRGQILQLRFEDLLARPAETMKAIGAFFELPPDPDFTRKAAALVRGAPPSRFDRLSPGERDELGAACRPGQVLLGRGE